MSAKDNTAITDETSSAEVQLESIRSAARLHLVNQFLYAAGILFFLAMLFSGKIDGLTKDNLIIFVPSVLSVIGAIVAMFKR